MNGYAVGREGTGVGFPCLGPGDLYPGLDSPVLGRVLFPGDVLGIRVYPVFDGDGAIYLEPQRGGPR